jgi:hypothetical protein
MAARRVVVKLCLVAAVMVSVAGCGGGGGAHSPELSGLPLVPGAQIRVNVKQCNKGAAAYCSRALVVVAPHYRSSHDLLIAERDLLRAEGWIGASPYTGVEVADESPRHTLRVTYATAQDDLQGYDIGWIVRPWSVVTALDKAMFNRTSAISMLLEAGSQ